MNARVGLKIEHFITRKIATSRKRKLFMKKFTRMRDQNNNYFYNFTPTWITEVVPLLYCKILPKKREDLGQTVGLQRGPKTTKI